MSTDTPYAYTLARPQDWDPQCFPTLDAAVAYIIKAGTPPYTALHYCPIGAHYADGREERVDLTPYLEEVPVDVGPIVREVSEKMTASRARYETLYPTDEDKAADRRSRCSGSGWPHEMDPNDVVRRIVEQSKWRWKGQPETSA